MANTFPTLPSEIFRIIRLLKSYLMEYLILCRYGASMAMPKLQCPKKILVNFIVEIATSFFIPTTQVIGKKITFYAVGLERIALR